MSLISCQNLRKSYFENANETVVLDGISLDVAAGESVAIIGASGSGKSTLLHLLAGLDKPSEGSVRFADRDITVLSDQQAAALRNRDMGFVYQFHHLLPEFSALENVAMPLLIAGERYKTALDKAKTILCDVSVSGRLAHFPNQLSGGERQRVAIARAIVHQPQVLFADEPTGNLDDNTGRSVFALLLERKKALGMACIIVTHDNELAQLCDRQIHLSSGVLRG